MKKVVILLIITMFVIFGCRRIPNSVETGVMPGEYEGLKNSDAIKEENNSLYKDVEETKKQLAKLKEDYLSLAKNNDVTLKKLDESESLLKVLQDGEIPKFTAENTDKINIINYLNEKKVLLDKSFRGLDILPVPTNENIILFKTKGYGSYYNQLFIWEIGQKEPTLIEGAHYEIDGNWEWLSYNYILISSANDLGSDKIVVDVAGKKALNKFKTSSENIYLIPDTSSILMQKSTNEATLIVLYDFLTGGEKELTFDFQNKNLKFKADQEKKEVVFSGTYMDNYETEYSMQAVMSIEKLKEKYSIKSINATATDTNTIDESGKSEYN